MDEATWAALAATLTMLGLFWTWTAFKRRGAANGLRALGIALIPAAAWLTGTLEMLTEIAGSVTDWATSLVFNPFTWAGICLAGLSVMLFVVSGILRDRQLAKGRTSSPDASLPNRAGDRSLQTPARPAKGPVDDDMADIEAILKSRGIE